MIRPAAPTIVSCPQSLQMQVRGRQWIPGLTQLVSKRPDMFAPDVWPGYYSRAKGAFVWDLDGNKYLDMSIGGIGANVLGYADPDVDDAVRLAIDKGVSSSLNCPEEVELAELLCSIHPWAAKARFARSGGEAMAVAVRIARAYTGRDKIAFCGYHGWHDWYLAANVGREDALDGHLLPGLSPRGVPRTLAGTAFPFHYNRVGELQDVVANHKSGLAAIVMEPIRNEQPAHGFLEAVRTLADENGAVLIVDEISAGFRMNSGGAHLQLNLRPDVAVFAKAIGNGYAISAVIGTVDVMESVQTTFVSSTNWTERIGPAAALATIRKHQALDAGAHLMRIGQQIQQGWKDAAAKHGLPISVKGIPPLSHFVFELADGQKLKAIFVRGMLERGILASTLFYAMHVHTENHVARYLAAVDEVFGEINQGIRNGSLANDTTRPAVAGFKRVA